MVSISSQGSCRKLRAGLAAAELDVLGLVWMACLQMDLLNA